MTYISPLYNKVNKPEIIVKTFTRQLDLKASFDTDQPIWLEIGFGVGKFLLELAQRFPHINFLGIEHNPYRYFRLREKSINLSVNNMRIMNIDAPMAVQHLLPESSIDRVMINFPDPWPKSKHEKNRLFGLSFIRCLARCLTKDAIARIQTDVDWYAEHIGDYMLLENLFDRIDKFDPDIEFPKTTFEERFIHQKIPYYRQMFQKRG